MFVVDFIASLALVAILASCMGGLRYVAPDKWIKPIMGLLFGAVATLQMHAPLEIYPGVIVDMRTVPVVLAAAFLGASGGIICLGIAVATRLYIGGLGTTPGIIGLVLAFGVGLSWHLATKHLPKRRIHHFFALAACACLHLGGAFWLPSPVREEFFSSVAPLLITLNLLSIPVVSAFLEHESRRLTPHESKDPHSVAGLLTWNEFRRDVALSLPDGGPQSLGGIAMVRVRHQAHVKALFGPQGWNRLLGKARLRLNAANDGGLGIALLGEGQLCFALTLNQAVERETFAAKVSKLLADMPYAMDRDTSFRMSADVEVFLAPDAQRMSDLLERLSKPRQMDASPSINWQNWRSGATAVRHSQTAEVAIDGENTLFEKADHLWTARKFQPHMASQIGPVKAEKRGA